MLRTALRAGLALLAISVLAGGVLPTRAAADEAEASGRPVTVKVLLSSRSDACYDPGDIPAIKKLARLEQQRINESGGVAGRKLHLEFLDDQRDNQRAVGNVHAALSDPDTLAVIGLSNPEIPFLSEVSVNSLFAKFPNVYTTRPSVAESSS